MTVIAFDGFDIYNVVSASDMLSAGTGWTQVSGTVGSFSGFTAGGRYGGTGQYIFHSSSGTSTTFALAKYVGANLTSVGFGIAWAKATLGSLTSAGKQVFDFYDSAFGLQVHLDVNLDGDIKAYRGSGQGTLLGTSDASRRITANVWAYITAEITFNASTGTVKVWIDGVQVMNLSSQNTNPTGNTGCNYVGFRATQILSSGEYTDDFYVTDGSQLGELRVALCMPSADTADKDWTRSTGSNNFALVDETGGFNSDTDYVQSSVVGDYDLYDVGDLPSNAAVVYAVEVISVAKKTDTGIRKYRNRLKSSSTFSNSSDFQLLPNYSVERRLLATDPDTGIGWTISGVNAIQLGIEMQA